MNRRRWSIVIGLALLVAGLPTCFHFSYQETAHPNVVIREGVLRPFEVELKVTVEMSGNMHGPSIPFLSRQTYEKSDWIYVESDRGRVQASDVVFTHWRACPDSLWWQKDMRGTIDFLESEMIVQIEMPRYDQSSSTPTHHVAWEHNGKYRIRRVSEPAVPLNARGCGN